MKGVLFTEFIEMIEDLMGLEFTNKVIDDACLENGGAYTAIGSYPHQDMFKLLESLSKHANSPQDKILKGYGECLFHRLSPSFQKELTTNPSTFSFLLQFGDIIQMETLKLHPEASMPTFSARHLGPGTMEFHYTSPRKLADLVEGLLLGCISYFNENIKVVREDFPAEGSRVRFFLQKVAANE